MNLEALAESEALAERLAGLETQLVDVTDAKLSVEKLIERIDEESRRLLGETIEKVRAEFSGLFERLFGGGQADIILDPEIDLLETTVEIMARPPGKEPRNISLLSGGEKTMTCVALLLALVARQQIGHEEDPRVLVDRAQSRKVDVDFEMIPIWCILRQRDVRVLRQ